MPKAKSFSFILITIFVMGLGNLSAFEIKFGPGLKQLSNPNNNPEQYDVSLPYWVVCHKQQLLFLDPIKKDILIFTTKGNFIKRVSTDIGDIANMHPIESFYPLSGFRYIMVSKKNKGVFIHDRLNRKITTLNKANSAFELLDYPSEVKAWNRFLFVSDLMTGRTGIFSKKGTFLGSIRFKGNQTQPISPIEQLSVIEEGKKAVLNVFSMNGKSRKFLTLYPNKGSEMILIKIIGADQYGQIYLEKADGFTHGVPDYSILKVSPLGQIIKEKPVKVTSLDNMDLKFRFVINDKGDLYQIRYLYKSLAVDKIEL